MTKEAIMKGSIKAWAVVNGKKIVQYQNYDKEPNDILFRIARSKMLAERVNVWPGCKVVQVLITPIRRKKK